MSDLEYSDIEPEQEEELDVEPNLEVDIDKEEKELGLSKTLTGKKATTEYIDSDEDNNIDDDDDDDDLLSDDDDLLSNVDDNDEEYNQVDNSENTAMITPPNSDIDSEDEDYLQKFEPESTSEYIKRVHPECLTGNTTEIEVLTIITRDKDNKIIDDNHKTNPFLSKYERTRILGQRAKQLNGGCTPYIKVPSGIIDGYLIAELELKEKKIPVIVRRPLPGGKSEYWKLQDLEHIY